MDVDAGFVVTEADSTAAKHVEQKIKNRSISSCDCNRRSNTDSPIKSSMVDL